MALIVHSTQYKTKRDMGTAIFLMIGVVMLLSIPEKKQRA